MDERRQKGGWLYGFRPGGGGQTSKRSKASGSDLGLRKQANRMTPFSYDSICFFSLLLNKAFLLAHTRAGAQWGTRAEDPRGPSRGREGSGCHMAGWLAG